MAPLETMHENSFCWTQLMAAPLVGYSGLGRTAGSTEPSDWMSRTLRGVNLPLEQTIGVLAAAAKERLPRHIESLKVPQHDILINSFVNNETRAYAVGVFKEKGQPAEFRSVRLHRPRLLPVVVPPAISAAGSGILHLPTGRGWLRSLLKIVSAYDDGRISSEEVGRHLAGINRRVSERDKGVSPRCIVSRRTASQGGESFFFNGLEREFDDASIPCISRGTDMIAMADVFIRMNGPRLIAMLQGKNVEFDSAVDTATYNAELAKLPTHPDSKLR